MDVLELEKWVESDEGKAWLESQKRPLLIKRDELLTELKSASGRLSELELSSKQTESILSEERAALAAVLVDQGLVSLLKEKRIYDSVIPSVTAMLKETYGITVKADGPNRMACGRTKETDGKESEISLADIVSTWSKTLEAKQVTPNNNSGGGTPPGRFTFNSSTVPELQKLSGQALAYMSDIEFRAMRNHALNSAKENI
jgi:hypothetical protein